MVWKERLAALSIEPCRAPRWANNGHLQTLLGSLLPSPKPGISGQRLLIDLPDGDQLSAHYFQGRLPVLLYLFHGLSGSSESDYIQRMLAVAMDRGYHVLAVNHRNCGSGSGLARQPYHSGRGEDLSAAIAFGRQRHPDKFHLALGFSLSGNALLLLCSGYRGECAPDFGIAVNAPIDLGKCARALCRGFSRIYDLRFSRRCRRLVYQMQRDGLLDRPYRIPPFTILTDFDTYYTAPAGGFRDREDYYQTCSAKPHLASVRVPMIVLTSMDDPMIDYRDYQSVPHSDHIHFHLEAQGGHMGYLSKSPTALGSRRWLDYVLDCYIDCVVRQFVLEKNSATENQAAN